MKVRVVVQWCVRGDEGCMCVRGRVRGLCAHTCAFWLYGGGEGGGGGGVRVCVCVREGEACVCAESAYVDGILDYLDVFESV